MARLDWTGWQMAGGLLEGTSVCCCNACSIEACLYSWLPAACLPPPPLFTCLKSTASLPAPAAFAAAAACRQGGPLAWREVGWKELPERQYSWQQEQMLRVYGEWVCDGGAGSLLPPIACGCCQEHHNTALLCLPDSVLPIACHLPSARLKAAELIPSIEPLHLHMHTLHPGPHC